MLIWRNVSDTIAILGRLREDPTDRFQACPSRACCAAWHSVWGFQNQGALLRSPCNKDHSTLESVLGPALWEPPSASTKKATSACIEAATKSHSLASSSPPQSSAPAPHSQWRSWRSHPPGMRFCFADSCSPPPDPGGAAASCW